MRNKITAVILCSILALFVVFLRIRLISLHRIDKIAEIEVQNEVRKKIRDSIKEKYTDFPQSKKDELGRQAYKQYLKDNKYAIKERIREIAEEKKAFLRNENNRTYLFGIDSYYWLRLIDNLIKKGHIGDKIVDGKQYDDLVDMPIEDAFSRGAHLILGKVVHKTFSFFNKDIDYETSLYFIPV